MWKGNIRAPLKLSWSLSTFKMSMLVRLNINLCQWNYHGIYIYIYMFIIIGHNLHTIESFGRVSHFIIPHVRNWFGNVINMKTPAKYPPTELLKPDRFTPLLVLDASISLIIASFRRRQKDPKNVIKNIILKHEFKFYDASN